MNEKFFKARKLRKNQTTHEQKMWNLLRGKQFQGIKFVRQYPIDKYIVDFACRSRKLIIEIDGGQHNENKNIENTSKLILILGLAISFISAFFDGAESMVSSTLIGDEIVDSTEYMLALSLIQVTITFFIWIGLFIKNKKPYNPFRKTEKYRFVSQLFLLVSDMFYVFALSKDALLGIILWSAFPILDIIGARVLLKEKLSFLQYFVLIMMILGAVFVSLS